MRKYHFMKMSMIFMKILAIFLAVIFPLFLSSLYINFNGQNDLRQEIIESAKPKIEFYANRLDNDFSGVKRSVAKLHINEDLQNLSVSADFLEHYIKMRAILDLETRMREITDLGEFVSEVNLYIPMIGKKIGNMVALDITAGEFEIFLNCIKDNKLPFAYVENNGEKDVYGKILTGTETYMCLMPYFSYVRIDGKQSPPYIVTIKVQKLAVERMLQEFSHNVQGSGLLLSNQNGLDFPGNTPPEMVQDLRKLIASGDQADTRTIVTTAELGGKKFILAYKRMISLDSTLLTYIPQESFFQSLGRYRTWLWSVSLLAVMVVVLFSFLVRKVIIKPLDSLVDGFDRVEKGDLNIDLKYKNEDEFGYLYKRFNGMCRRLATLIEQVYEQRIRVREAELKQLQYQINPHFLYNSLFILYRMAKMNNTEGILKLSQHLGGYYQFVTKCASDEVTLQDEVNHVKDYIEIQSIRFFHRIRVEFGEIPEGMGNMMVPRLILQPLVENCYNHGLKTKLKDGILKVRITRNENVLIISVEDNGEELEEQDLLKMQEALAVTGHMQEVSGLMNIHRRLRIKYGPDSGIFLGVSELGGLCAEVRIDMGGGAARV